MDRPKVVKMGTFGAGLLLRALERRWSDHQPLWFRPTSANARYDFLSWIKIPGLSVGGPTVFVIGAAIILLFVLGAGKQDESPPAAQASTPAPPQSTQQATAPATVQNWFTWPAFLVGLLLGILIGIIGASIWQRVE